MNPNLLGRLKSAMYDELDYDSGPVPDVEWSQSFPDPLTHPDFAKSWFLANLNSKKREIASLSAEVDALRKLIQEAIDGEAP